MASAALFAFSYRRCDWLALVYVKVGDRKARLLEYAKKSKAEAEALLGEFGEDRVFLVDVSKLTEWGAAFLNRLNFSEAPFEPAVYDATMGTNSTSREQALRRL